MISRKKTFILFALLVVSITAFFPSPEKEDDRFITWTTNPKENKIALYWKNTEGKHLRSLGNLARWLDQQDKKLVFAMNAGMYTTTRDPLGLFIDQQKTITALNKKQGRGNFYLKPNGVFYITNGNTAHVIKTDAFPGTTNLKYATQSGPMLVIDGKLHSAFIKGSKNLEIRNGVGILPDGRILLAMSKQKINFYDFATYFLEQGCQNALYLDGHVSRTYCPSKNWVQKDGNFGVMIGITE